MSANDLLTSSPSDWRSSNRRNALALFLTVAGITTLASAPAFADVVRITSIDGNYNPNHSQVIQVHPGDVVSLSADMFSEMSSDGYQPENQNLENFIWNADDRAQDQCDASQPQSCQGVTSFEVTNYGVNYYVPYSINAEVTLTVRSRLDWSSDSVILQNVNSSPDYQPPTQVVTSPTDYNYNNLNPDNALAGQGRWVVVGDVRYFVPYGYATGWVPYQNGYWTWVNGDGWTWVSYDPWGWMTDHYGTWRHHNSYGWMWLPFDDFRYRPHCVTFYNGDGDADDWIGWHPFFDGDGDGWRNRYRDRDHDDGFDDDFWEGRDGFAHWGRGDGWEHGYNGVHRGDFDRDNIRDHEIDRDQCADNFQRSYGSNNYGAYPGARDARDLDGSRQWVEQRIGRQVPETSVVTRQVGDNQLRNPQPIRQVPTEYRPAPDPTGDRFNRPIPVGSIVTHQNGNSGGPTIVPPTSNGRGISVPPRVTDPNDGTVRQLPPMTNTPAQPSRGNPIYRPAPVPTQGNRPNMPGYQPGVPAPQPTYAPTRPQPEQPQPVFQPRPQPEQPQPVFQPRPQPEQPQPVFQPRPQPEQPQPVFQPRPQPEQPQPVFQPRPQPEQPQPVFQPRPQPEQPQPVFQPRPQPQPQPVFQPRPQPQPQPVFQPRPQPMPQPMPQPSRGGPMPQPSRGGPMPMPGPRRGAVDNS